MDFKILISDTLRSKKVLRTNFKWSKNVFNNDKNNNWECSPLHRSAKSDLKWYDCYKRNKVTCSVTCQIR